MNGKSVPTCIGCEHYQVYAKYRGRVHSWCCHPLFTRCGRNRWIPARERGNTSPQWCPKRITFKLIMEEHKDESR